MIFPAAAQVAIEESKLVAVFRVGRTVCVELDSSGGQDFPYYLLTTMRKVCRRSMPRSSPLRHDFSPRYYERMILSSERRC